MPLHFTKMHGLGNDYVYVDCFAHSLEGIDLPTLARTVSDRHRGIGSDGLILIAPPSPEADADVRMVMFNADGSRSEMCGNGVRCVAKYAIEHNLIREVVSSPNSRGRKPAGLPHESNLTLLPELNTAVNGFLGDTLALNEIADVDLRVETDRGVLALTAFTSNGIVRSVRVDMGSPILAPSEIPVRIAGSRSIKQAFSVDGIDLHMTCVSMGNPHAVFFVPDLTAIDLPRIGPIIERHALFPNRVNAHFAQIVQRGASSPADEVRMRTWERGAGITQACGTGACAVVVAGVLEERLSRSVLVHLPGGDLRIDWPDDGSVFMTGPADEVFTGDWPL